MPLTLPDTANANDPGHIADHNLIVAALSELESASGGSPIITVAANNTTATEKANATYICDGTADNVEIQAAIDAVAQYASGGGTIRLLAGTYVATDTISLSHPSDSGNTYPMELIFERGAKLTFPTVSATQPIIKVESSDCVIRNPWITGSGSKGNGQGLVFGGDTTNFGGRYTKTVYRCSVFNPRIQNCNYGISFGADLTGSSSTGDCTVFGGYVTACVDGIHSAGFVNRLFGTTVATCTNNIHGTTDRQSHMIEGYGLTLSQWDDAGIWLESDKGSLFTNCWLEHTAAQPGAPSGAPILLGSASKTARDTKFLGNTSVTMYDEAYAVDIYKGLNTYIQNLNVSTNGDVSGTGTPTGQMVRLQSTTGGLLTIDRITYQTGGVPADWNYSKLVNNLSSTAEIVVKALPLPGGAANETVGDKSPTPSDADYYIDVTGSPNSATYWAKSNTGHIAYMEKDTATTSGLKAVLETLEADHVHFRFGPKRYHFLDMPVGNETGAGSEDHGQFGSSAGPTVGLTFSGDGWLSTIISNRTNWSSAADTEPLSFTNCQYITIKDLTVESCGSYKSTTDAIDLDQGAHSRVERVRVTKSRSRGIIIDGGDAGKNAGYNIIRDCLVQGRPDKPQLALVSGGSLTPSTSYRYVIAFTDADLGGAQTPGETKPSDEAILATPGSGTLTIKVGLPLGPYTTTERKIYRSTVGSSTWVRVATISDNTTTFYNDTGGAGTGVTMPVSHLSNIFQAGIELLGTKDSLVTGNYVDGVGASSATQSSCCGINVLRKGSGSTTVQADRNKVVNNTIRQSYGYGIKVLGGSDNLISGNTVSNSGTNAAKVQNLRMEGATSATSDRNIFTNNRCFDDQDANSWSVGQTVNNTITISGTGTPTNTTVTYNDFSAGASAVVSDSGTTSKIVDNIGWNPQGVATITVGGSPYTYTSGSSPEMVYISGGTVSNITRGGTSLASASPFQVYLPPNTGVVVTYSSAPTMTKDRL